MEPVRSIMPESGSHRQKLSPKTVDSGMGRKRDSAQVGR
jgi:hypothetical protein